MADEEKKVEEVATTSSPEETNQPQENLEVSKEELKEAPLKEGEAEQKEQEVKKPSRLDKRVEQLQRKRQGIDELLNVLTEKRKEHEMVQRSEIPDFLFESKEGLPPILQPGETEISPDELEERIAKREQLLKEQLKQEVRAELEAKEKQERYTKTIKSHLTELEEVKSMPMMDDEDFANEVKELYEKNNWVLGINGEPIFIGAVSPKEAYNLVKQKFEKLREKLSGQVAQRLTDQISSSAIAPSKGEPVDDLEVLKSKALETGRDEDWAEYLKRRLKVK